LSNFILPSTCLRSANTSGFRQQVLTLDGQNYNYLDEVWAYNAALPRCENFVRTIPFTAERKSGPFLNLIDAASFVGVAGGNSSNNSISVVAWCDLAPIDCSKRYMTVFQSVSTCNVSFSPPVVRLPNVTTSLTGKDYTGRVPFSINVKCPASEGQAKSVFPLFHYSVYQNSWAMLNDGTATNVGIILRNQNSGTAGELMISGYGANSVPLSSTATTENTFNYSAEYTKIDSRLSVGPGTVSSTATVTMKFE
jgi:type 1 fimbria pilin